MSLYPQAGGCGSFIVFPLVVFFYALDAQSQQNLAGIHPWLLPTACCPALLLRAELEYTDECSVSRKKGSTARLDAFIAARVGPCLSPVVCVIFHVTELCNASTLSCPQNDSLSIIAFYRFGMVAKEI